MQIKERISSIATWCAAMLTFVLILPGLVLCYAEWGGNDFEDGVLTLLLVSAPVTCAVACTGVVYIPLKIWSALQGKKLASSLKVTYSAALLSGIVILWGLPPLWTLLKKGDFTLGMPVLMWPSFWLQLESPQHLWLFLLISSSLGALLGYKFSVPNASIRQVNAKR